MLSTRRALHRPARRFVLTLCVAGMVFQQGLPARAAPATGAHEAVPATLGTVSTGTTEVFLSGLGTVQAWQSVTARAQVNGYLSSIRFREGQAVKRGDVLATIDPRPYAAVLAQAQARMASDQANLDNDKVNFTRDSTLATRGFQTLQQAGNDQALVREYTANLQSDAASIAAAQLNLDFCTIRAPIDGVVGFRLVDVGNLIEASAETAIVSLQQIQPIAVVFTLPQFQFEEVEQALQHGELPVQAYSPDEKTLLDTGTLVAPDNQIATATGTISLKTIFPNGARKLWPGQSVQARLGVRTEQNTLEIPDGAVQHGPDGLYVFTVAGNMTVHQQPITVGYDNGTRSTVTEGLKSGDRIVLSGQSRLQEGTEVRSVAATPNAAKG